MINIIVISVSATITIPATRSIPAIVAILLMLVVMMLMIMMTVLVMGVMMMGMIKGSVFTMPHAYQLNFKNLTFTKILKRKISPFST